MLVAFRCISDTWITRTYALTFSTADFDAITIFSVVAIRISLAGAVAALTRTTVGDFITFGIVAVAGRTGVDAGTFETFFNTIAKDVIVAFKIFSTCAIF